MVVLGLLGDVAYAIYAAPQRNKPVSEGAPAAARAGRRPGLLGRALEAAPRRGARLVDGRVLFSACRSGTC